MKRREVNCDSFVRAHQCQHMRTFRRLEALGVEVSINFTRSSPLRRRQDFHLISCRLMRDRARSQLEEQLLRELRVQAGAHSRHGDAGVRGHEQIARGRVGGSDASRGGRRGEEQRSEAGPLVRLGGSERSLEYPNYLLARVYQK